MRELLRMTYALNENSSQEDTLVTFIFWYYMTSMTQTKTNHIIVNLVSQGFLQVSGQDAKKLLQGQLTCDLEKITPSQSSLAAHCNPKGRVISFFRIFMIQNDYYLQMPKNLLPIALAALQKYAVFYKVSLTDASTLLQKIGISGNPPTITPDLTSIAIPGNRYEIIGSPTTISKLWDKLTLTAQIASETNWKHLDIAAHIPTIYPETSEKFLPHELQLHLLNAISFDKGCYTGQEIIARMQYLGKLKNHLYRTEIKADSPPQPGAEIMTESGSNGHIVDCCQIDYNTFEVLLITQKL